MKGWLGAAARGAAARVNSVAAAVSAASDRADSALARFQAEHDDAAAEGESPAEHDERLDAEAAERFARVEALVQKRAELCDLLARVYAVAAAAPPPPPPPPPHSSVSGLLWP